MSNVENGQINSSVSSKKLTNRQKFNYFLDCDDEQKYYLQRAKRYWDNKVAWGFATNQDVEKYMKIHEIILQKIVSYGNYSYHFLDQWNELKVGCKKHIMDWNLYSTRCFPPISRTSFWRRMTPPKETDTSEMKILLQQERIKELEQPRKTLKQKTDEEIARWKEKLVKEAPMKVLILGSASQTTFDMKKLQLIQVKQCHIDNLLKKSKQQDEIKSIDINNTHLSINSSDKSTDKP